MNRFLFLLTIPLFLLASCLDDDMLFDIGKNRVDIKTHMAFVDTVTVNSYTVMLDSIPTSGLGVPAVVVGKYYDSQFGTLTSSSFFRVNPASNISGSTIPDDAVFDSIKLFLRYNSYYSGDTLAPFTINVHRLKEKMKSNDDNYFYNNDSVEAYSSLFGKTTFVPHPNSTDTVWVTLDHDFGQELFNLVEDNDEVVKDNDQFHDYFQGFLLHYDVTNNAILGFQFPASESDTATPCMRMYFHYSDQGINRESLDFEVQTYNYINSNEKLQFNRFGINSSMPLPTSQRSKLPASSTNNCSYAMAGVGIVTRFEVPFLKELLSLHDDVHIVDAVLEIEPARNTYINDSLPDAISLYETDKLNNFGDAVQDKYGDSQTPYFQLDWLYQEETYYRFDVTSFVQEKLALETDEIPAMLLSVSGEEFYKTTQRIVMGSRDNPKNKVTLKIYYINVE
jgi:hypothetical protein